MTFENKFVNKCYDKIFFRISISIDFALNLPKYEIRENKLKPKSNRTATNELMS